MKKILFVAISLVNGGAEKSLVNLLNAIPEKSYSIDLLLFRKEGLFYNQLPSNVNVIESKELSSLYKKLSESGIYGAIKILGTFVSKLLSHSEYEMREFRWRHFYTHFVPMLNKKYNLAIAFTGGEVTYFVKDKISADQKIAWVHTDYINAGCNAQSDDRYYKEYDKVITISDECAKILKKCFPEMSKKFYSLPNITSSDVLNRKAEEFYPTEYKGAVNIILSVGRLVPLKRFDEAIRAAAILRNKEVKFKWFLIGNGECERKLKAMINEYDLTGVFELLGPKENPYPYIRNAKLVVQTSSYEGKSVVLDEAKILKTPIVSTNYDTVYDQIKDGEEGLVVDMDAAAISNGIEKLLLDQNYYDKILKVLNSNEYGNQKDIDRYIDLFEGR